MVARGADGVISTPLAALKSYATDKTRDCGGKTHIDRVIDHAIAALAERQHGVVAIWQLLALGLGTDAIQYRVSIGRLHRRPLHEEDRTTHDGIPITTVTRTIFDLAARTREDGLTYLIEEADRKDRLDLQALERAIARRPRAAGTKRLNAVLATYRGPADTRSHLERGFRKLIAKARLPQRLDHDANGVLADIIALARA